MVVRRAHATGGVELALTLSRLTVLRASASMSAALEVVTA